MFRRSLIIIALGASLATLTGCGGTGDPVDGRAFALVDVTGIPALADAPLRLEFTDGNVGVSGGCNLIGGAYDLDGETLVVETMMQTEMACEQSRMDQDTAIIELLQSRPTIEVDDSVLTVVNGDRVTTWDAVPPMKEE